MFEGYIYNPDVFFQSLFRVLGEGFRARVRLGQGYFQSLFRVLVGEILIYMLAGGFPFNPFSGF